MNPHVAPAKSTWLGFPRGVVLFTVAYLLLAVYGALTTGNREFLFYIVVLLLLIGAVTALHRRIGLSGLVLWGLALWGGAHMAGGLLPVPESWPINGEVRVLYSWWLIQGYLKFDHVVHAFGFGVTTLVCWEALRAAIADLTGRSTVEPRFGLLVLCASAAMGFGALNEIVEFAATLLVPETNVGGYYNTGWDLVANAVGALLALLLLKCKVGTHRGH